MNNLYGFRFGKAAAGSWPKPPTADAHIVDLGALPAVEVYARQVVPTTTTSAPTSTTDRPFFPDPATMTAHATSSADDDGNGSDSGSLAKSVLEYAILAVGLVLIGSFMLIRINRARRANRGPSAFFSMSSFRSPNHQLPTHRPTYPRTHGLPRVDLAYPPPSRSNPIRSNDIDAFGRRLGPGEINDKDQLPPYEVAGGPPKYFELAPSGTRGNWNNRPTSQESRTTGSGHPRMSSATASVNHANAGGEEESRERADPDDHHDQHSTPPGLSSPTTEAADHQQPNPLANAENAGRNHD